MCVFVSNVNGAVLYSRTLAQQDHYSGHQIIFFPAISPLFNSLSMIQQVIPMDLIPSYLIYNVLFPFSYVVITPSSTPSNLAPIPIPTHRVVPAPAGCCSEEL